MASRLVQDGTQFIGARMMLSSGEDACIPACIQVASNWLLRIERGLARLCSTAFDGRRGPFAALSRASRRTVVKARLSPAVC